MKRKILLTIALMMLIFIPSVKAEGNMKVIFNTSFEEQIDINKIEKIYIMMDDSNEKDYEIVLERKDNFRVELNNIPSGDVIINSVTVSRDYTVDYDYDTIITKNNEEETVVSILVKKVEKDPNRKKPDVTYEYIAGVLGYDPLSITTTNQTTTNMTTNASNSETPSEPINNDEPIVITSSSSTTTTKSESELKEIEETKKEEEKKEEQTKRKSIYLLILLVVIAAILIIGVLVGIKIANANK